MRKWYELFIRKVKESYSDLVVVDDADRLGRVAEIRDALAGQFDLHDYEGELALRAFLSGRERGRAVIFMPPGATYLPYDVESAAHPVSWQLSGLFAGLDIAVLKEFPPRYYQRIYETYSAVQGSLSRAGAAETLQLLVQWVWGVNLREVGGPDPAVALLILIYREGEGVPPPVEEQLRRQVELPGQVWSGRQQFYRWLAAQWETYLGDRLNGEATLVNFGEPALKQCISDLFQEGVIRHCPRGARGAFDRLLESDPWLQVGISRDGGADFTKEVDDLVGKISTLLEEGPVEWGKVGALWGRLSYLKDLERERIDGFDELDRKINRRFARFVMEEYDQLFYRSYKEGPVTIDQVMHYLGGRGGGKKALLCLDCMGYQEWFCIRDFLVKKGLDPERFLERPLYAALPTLTGVSRKALFSGIKPNRELPAEHKGFLRHIEQNWPGGRDKQKQLFLNAPMQWQAVYEDCDYVGIVFNLVDDVAHGSVHVKDKGVMQQTLLNLLSESELDRVIKRFLELGYQVYLTSDHGSIWCAGNGITAEKYLVEDKARRALVYPSRLLAEEFARGKELLLYENISVTGDKVLLFPRGRIMFGPAGMTAVTHGGIHIEEVIITFVEVLS